MIDNKYFSFYWENPLKTYNKIKKYFKPLKKKISITFNKGRNKAKILDIKAYDLMWKDKWNSPRHEHNPVINISLFNRLHIQILYTLKSDSMNDMVYWEAALWWLYYRKSLGKAIKNSTGWTSLNVDTGKYEPIPFMVVKEPYHTMYLDHTLPIIKYERNIKN